MENKANEFGTDFFKQIAIRVNYFCKFYAVQMQCYLEIRNGNQIISNNTNTMYNYRKHIDDDFHLHYAINSCNFLTDFYHFVSNSIHLMDFVEIKFHNCIFDQIISLLLFL